MEERVNGWRPGDPYDREMISMMKYIKYDSDASFTIDGDAPLSNRNLQSNWTRDYGMVLKPPKYDPKLEPVRTPDFTHRKIHLLDDRLQGMG